MANMLGTVVLVKANKKPVLTDVPVPTKIRIRRISGCLCGEESPLSVEEQELLPG